ncbi:hypothetical protein KM043_004611 [Ampulex compressa]|nr:hypothetical protein KM043_004611 [Ampulex compressa]
MVVTSARQVANARYRLMQRGKKGAQHHPGSTRPSREIAVAGGAGKEVGGLRHTLPYLPLSNLLHRGAHTPAATSRFIDRPVKRSRDRADRDPARPPFHGRSAKAARDGGPRRRRREKIEGRAGEETKDLVAPAGPEHTHEALAHHHRGLSFLRSALAADPAWREGGEEQGRRAAGRRGR